MSRTFSGKIQSEKTKNHSGERKNSSQFKSGSKSPRRNSSRISTKRISKNSHNSKSKSNAGKKFEVMAQIGIAMLQMLFFFEIILMGYVVFKGLRMTEDSMHDIYGANRVETFVCVHCGHENTVTNTCCPATRTEK